MAAIAPLLGDQDYEIVARFELAKLSDAKKLRAIEAARQLGAAYHDTLAQTAHLDRLARKPDRRYFVTALFQGHGTAGGHSWTAMKAWERRVSDPQWSDDPRILAFLLGWRERILQTRIAAKATKNR